jgi:hypothetical protein
MDNLYISQDIIWKGRKYYISNMFINGRILIRLSNSEKKFTVYYTEITPA